MGSRVRVLLLTVCCLGPSSLNAELVGLWRFDASVFPQPDSSGKGNHGAKGEDPSNDVAWVNDSMRGGVMEFDGDRDYLEVADSDSISIEGAISIATWANFSSFANWNSIMGKTGLPEENNHNRPAPYDFYTVHQESGLPRIYIGDGGAGIGNFDAAAAPELETWQHIAVTVSEDGEVLHYLNGEINGEGFIDRQRVDLDQNLYIGSRADFVTNMFGRLDDVALFNESISQAQVQKIMSGDFGDFIPTAGDYNADGKVDIADIDALTLAIINVSTDRKFDANGDGSINGADRDTWVNRLFKSWYGDSNGDKEFNSTDFVQVFVQGEYEDAAARNSTWADGDWNGDQEFNSSDFVTAFVAGGYEKGKRAAVGVPEPTSLALLIVCFLPFRRRVG